MFVPFSILSLVPTNTFLKSSCVRHSVTFGATRVGEMRHPTQSDESCVRACVGGGRMGGCITICGIHSESF